MAFVNQVDLGGATGGTGTAPLPGLDYNCINRGCGKDEIIALTAEESAQWRAAMLPIYAEMGDRVGKQLILDIQKTVGVAP